MLICFLAVLVDCRVMKNRKLMGHLSEQSVRKKSKPFIVEVDDRWVDVAFESVGETC